VWWVVRGTLAALQVLALYYQRQEEARGMLIYNLMLPHLPPPLAEAAEDHARGLELYSPLTELPGNRHI
jgi:hypothetical protein